MRLEDALFDEMDAMMELHGQICMLNHNDAGSIRKVLLSFSYDLKAAEKISAPKQQAAVIQHEAP